MGSSCAVVGSERHADHRYANVWLERDFEPFAALPPMLPFDPPGTVVQSHERATGRELVGDQVLHAVRGVWPPPRLSRTYAGCCGPPGFTLAFCWRRWETPFLQPLKLPTKPYAASTSGLERNRQRAPPPRVRTTASPIRTDSAQSVPVAPSTDRCHPNDASRIGKPSTARRPPSPRPALLVNTPDGTVQRHTSRNSTVQIAQRCLS